MTVLIATLCFTIGLCVGAVLFRQFKSDAARVEFLEQKIKTMAAEHSSYKHGVHSHFNTTAKLVNNLTDSYREVYRQLATSAQALCPEDISNQLSLSSQAYDLLSPNEEGRAKGSSRAEIEPLFPPRDYSPKSDPNQKGSLAEDFGLEKAETETESDAEPETKTEAEKVEPK